MSISSPKTMYSTEQTVFGIREDRGQKLKRPLARKNQLVEKRSGFESSKHQWFIFSTHLVTTPRKHIGGWMASEQPHLGTARGILNWVTRTKANMDLRFFKRKRRVCSGQTGWEEEQYSIFVAGFITRMNNHSLSNTDTNFNIPTFGYGVVTIIYVVPGKISAVCKCARWELAVEFAFLKLRLLETRVINNCSSLELWGARF